MLKLKTLLKKNQNIIAAEKAREFVTLPSAQDLSSMGDDDDSKGKRKSKEINAFDTLKHIDDTFY